MDNRDSEGAIRAPTLTPNGGITLQGFMGSPQNWRDVDHIRYQTMVTPQLLVPSHSKLLFTEVLVVGTGI